MNVIFKIIRQKQNPRAAHKFKALNHGRKKYDPISVKQ